MRRALRSSCLVVFLISCSLTSATATDLSGMNEARTPLAVVDGKIWYVDEVEGAVALRIFQHQMDIYSLLIDEAERRIDDQLLSQEAERRGVSKKTLLESILEAPESEAFKVTSEDVDQYLAAHPPTSGVTTEQARTRIRHYLVESKRIGRRIAFLAALREQAGAKILLQQPDRPRTEIEIGDAPARGPADADVTLIHFASLGSRSAARSADNIARLRKAHPHRIRWIHMNFFNGRDERSLSAARLGFLALDAGRFWEYHDAVLAEEGKSTLSDLRSIARESGVSKTKIEAADDSLELLRRVKADLDAGNRAGVQREPSLFINGRFVSGLIPYEELEKVLIEELARRQDLESSSDSDKQD